ncbi:unnamed protein product [marine sediment metagenome]|uniref:Ribbon-helix-helix protein CopG domain-containing protein n=1 Tax=marine sediment metagenome TaxID=412755 RepID=X0ZAZ9_9ZZZZ
MVMVDVDEELYASVKKVIEKDRVEYPTLQNFVNKAIRDKVKKLEGK